MKKPDTPPLDPIPAGPTAGRPNETSGCPTGLADDPRKGHQPLGVEKLEGRQEAGRDAQDEAEEDEPGAS